MAQYCCSGPEVSKQWLGCDVSEAHDGGVFIYLFMYMYVCVYIYYLLIDVFKVTVVRNVVYCSLENRLPPILWFSVMRWLKTGNHSHPCVALL